MEYNSGYFFFFPKKQKKGFGLNCNTLKTRQIPLVNMCWNYINCYYFILCDPENLEEVIENKKD